MPNIRIINFITTPATGVSGVRDNSSSFCQFNRVSTNVSHSVTNRRTETARLKINAAPAPFLRLPWFLWPFLSVYSLPSFDPFNTSPTHPILGMTCRRSKALLKSQIIQYRLSPVAHRNVAYPIPTFSSPHRSARVSAFFARACKIEFCTIANQLLTTGSCANVQKLPTIQEYVICVFSAKLNP